MPRAKYFQPEKLSSRISLIRVPVPNGRSVKFSNCYVIGTKSDFFLVDSGWLDKFNSLNFKRALSSIGYSIQNLNGIIVTHYHQDHLGLALDLKSEFGVSIYLSKKELEVLENHGKYVDWLSSILLKSGLSPEEVDGFEKRNKISAYDRIDISGFDILRGGESFLVDEISLKVVFTPGHTPGSISLYIPEEATLLTGDFVLPRINSNIGPYYSGHNPLKDYFSSLALAEELDVSIALPGHEFPFAELRKRLDDIMAHHEKRVSEVEHLVQSGVSNPQKIAANIGWGPGPWNGLSPHIKALALREVLSYTLFLRDDAKIMIDDSGENINCYPTN